MRVCPLLIRVSTAAAVSAMLACGGQSQPSTPTQPSQPSPPPTPAVTLTSVVVGVAGNTAAALAPGDKLQLYAQAVYSDESRSDVTNVAVWQSSNPAIATVSSGGIVTAAIEGALDVSATYQGRSGSLHADVQKPGCRATLSPQALTFNAFGTYATVNVRMTDSACRWTVRSDASWLPFTYDPKKSGDGAFEYAVPGNTTTEARTADVVVSVVGGPSVVHTVRQERPVGCSYVVTPDHLTFPSAGGSGAFDVTTTPGDCQWTVYNPTGTYSTVPIRLTGSASGTGNARVTYTTVGTNPYTDYDVVYTLEIRGLSGMNPPGLHKVTVLRK
jgi:hypothetical protein